MTENYHDILKTRISGKNLERLTAVDNQRLHRFVADAIRLCDPKTVLVYDDSPESIQENRQKALEIGEEKPLNIEGHTIHYDGPNDQGRDRAATKYLVPKNQTLSKTLNQIEREEGLAEVRDLLASAMKERTMIVRFLSLGPTGSEFSIPCVECTDSWYVTHSLDLLYRTGYEQFKSAGKDTEFFCILHSAGKVNERMVSVDVDNRRIYIDHTTDTVYSVNTQYAGNTVGLKKLALRLTIQKADREGWLAEHMFLSGVFGPNGRKTYLAGAFPSGCGKTSTAMLPGEKILGDDIAYFRAVDGECRAVNAESGIFGIIQNVSSSDDPTIWEALTKPGEVIFSNVLVNNGRPYWLGMGVDIPDSGESFTGEWHKGKKDAEGEEIPPAHKNARYAIALEALGNCDTELNNPRGVVLGGIMYGGRDARSYVPVQQSFDWDHGIVAYAASLETETTFTIIGKEGVPEINVMSIQDFVAIPLGKYISNNIEFGKKLSKQPMIFGVNYFLRDREGRFVNGVRDKHVWVKWMERRIHNEVGVYRSPTGLLPKYEDLVPLFKQVLDKAYPEGDYVKQFTIRIPENLEKVERIVKFQKQQGPDVPSLVYQVLEEQRQRLLAVQKKYGDYVSPFELPAE